MKTQLTDNQGRKTFTLVEVVLALGVIAIAIVAILALFPVALNTNKSAQDVSRAPQIAQDILDSIASQAQSALSSPTHSPIISQSSPSFSYSAVDLTATTSPCPPATPNFYADKDGNLIPNPPPTAANPVYAIYICTKYSPPGFPNASQVTVRVAWPQNASAANQTSHDYVRMVSQVTSVGFTSYAY